MYRKSSSSTNLAPLGHLAQSAKRICKCPKSAGQKEGNMRKKKAAVERPRYRLVQHHRRKQTTSPDDCANYSSPRFDGVCIRQLQKGDTVLFEATVRGYGTVRVRIKVTLPKQGGVEIIRVIKTGKLHIEIPKKDLGLHQGFRGHFVLRGWIEGEGILGWVGRGADVFFTEQKQIRFKSVTNITLNDTLIVFPRTSACH